MLKKFLLALMVCVGVGTVAVQSAKAELFFAWRNVIRDNKAFANYHRMPVGTYNLNIFYYEGSDDPSKKCSLRFNETGNTIRFQNSDNSYSYLTKGQYLSKVAEIFQSHFNNLNLGITINVNTMAYSDLTGSSDLTWIYDKNKNTSMYNGIEFIGEGGNDAYTYAYKYNISESDAGWVGMRIVIAGSYNTLRSAIMHELGHVLGFNHVVDGQQGTGYGNHKTNNSMGETQNLRVDKNRKDYVSNLDVLYNKVLPEGCFKVWGYAGSDYSDGLSEALFVDMSQGIGKVVLQTCIDKNGYYEFRLRGSSYFPQSVPFKVILCDRKINRSFYESGPSFDGAIIKYRVISTVLYCPSPGNSQTIQLVTVPLDSSASTPTAMETATNMDLFL